MSVSTKLVSYFSSRNRGWIITLFVAVCLLYLPFLGNPFMFDDLLFVLGGAAEKYAHSWFHFDLRWLSYASLGWTEVLFSNAATHFFHLGNMLLHAANVILLFYLLQLWMGVVLPEFKKDDVVKGAWFGALIFALHPVAVYAAGYVVQRSILMATFFALLMQLAYLRGLLGGKKHWLLLAVGAYFMAVFSKEHSVLMPAVLLAETVLLRGKIMASRPMQWVTWGGFVVVGLLVVFIAKGVFGTPYEAMAAALFEQQGVVESSPMLHLLSVLTQAGLFFKYLALWLMPNPAWMSLDMREPFVASLWEWRGWLGAASFLAYGFVSLRLLLRGGIRGLIGFALLYPWLQFWLEFSSVRVQEPFVLYRSYLWMPGMMLFVPLMLAKWPGRKTVFALGLSVLLLAPLAVNRLWVFADNYRLWNDAALLLPDDSVPGADRILFNRAQAEVAANKLDAAIADFERSVAISPQYAQVHFQLGWTYGLARRYEDALVEFDKTIAIDPEFGNAYYAKAMLLKMRHKDKQAAELMAKSCELKTEIACLIVNRKIEH